MSPDLRRQVERNRDFIETRREDDQAIQHERKRYMANTRKTAYGDRVPVWPSADPVWDRIERLTEALTDLYDEAAAQAERADSMEKTTSPSVARFPALGG